MESGQILFIFGLFAVVGMGVWLWALIDAIRVPDDSMYVSGTKTVWVIVIILTGVVGAIIYFIREARAVVVLPGPVTPHP
jgi:hypothetical protein